MTDALLHRQPSALTRWLLATLLAFCGSWSFAAEPNFPALTERVVDQAQLLSPAQNAALTTKLAAYETESSDQVVVVTVATLDGFDIADYANRLGRQWGIGTAENDNGILLLVAPKERKVRIEVGYGLEGALTDALSSTIIQRELLPAFRKNDYPAGIDAGVNAILAAIKGEYKAPPGGATGRRGKALPESIGKLIPLIFIAMVAIPQVLRRSGLNRAANGAFPAGFAGLAGTLFTGNLLIGLLLAIAAFTFIYFNSSGGNSGGGRRPGHRGPMGGGLGGSGGFGGGGFSGGGGSFGGGGASGGW
ncbi:MAG: TPM domain-containing protein [Granulosicoccus sp.]